MFSLIIFFLVFASLCLWACLCAPSLLFLNTSSGTVWDQTQGNVLLMPYQIIMQGNQLLLFLASQFEREA